MKHGQKNTRRKVAAFVFSTNRLFIGTPCLYWIGSLCLQNCLHFLWYGQQQYSVRLWHLRLCSHMLVCPLVWPWAHITLYHFSLSLVHVCIMLLFTPAQMPHHKSCDNGQCCNWSTEVLTFDFTSINYAGCQGKIQNSRCLWDGSDVIFNKFVLLLISCLSCTDRMNKSYLN